MEKLSVYAQLTAEPAACLSVLRNEIGMKTSCMPFAVKLISAMKTLDIQTDSEALNAADVLLSGLQTLSQGGIIPEDYDKIDFVKRGKVIVPSARVEAFLRAAARKGYRISDTIAAVPKEDAETTYFKENFCNGDIVYTLEDRRINTDREVTAKRLVDGYFKKFICRLDIHEIQRNARVAMTVCEMTVNELLNIASASEQGIFRVERQKYKDNYGYTRYKRIVTDKLNTDTFWVKWTGEMVNKTVIRRALKRVKEILPELHDPIYAFEAEDAFEHSPEERPVIEIPVEAEEASPRVDLFNLTDEQKEDAARMLEIFKANPKLAEDKFAQIKGRLEAGEDVRDIADSEYASIRALSCSAKKWEQLRGYFDA